MTTSNEPPEFYNNPPYLTTQELQDLITLEAERAGGGGGGGGNGTVTVTGQVEIKNDSGNPIPVSGALTNTELRATAVPVSGPLTDTQLRATAVPVSGPLTQAQLTAAALATDSVSQAIRDRLPTTLVGGRLNVEPLGIPGVARQLAAGAATANTTLTVGVGRISIYARGADIRYAIGSSTQTASATTSHFIASGERLDLDVPATPNIAVIRAGSTDGTLELTELS
jgi:hypothetical protein